MSPDAYARMVVEAPGETLDPGIFDAIEDDGKIGDASVQDAGVPFDVRVFATDAYWNPVSDLDPGPAGDHGLLQQRRRGRAAGQPPVHQRQPRATSR